MNSHDSNTNNTAQRCIHLFLTVLVTPSTRTRSQLTATLLSAFLSSVGAANFYIGRNDLAAGQVVLLLMLVVAIAIGITVLCVCRPSMQLPFSKLQHWRRVQVPPVTVKQLLQLHTPSVQFTASAGTETFLNSSRRHWPESKQEICLSSMLTSLKW